MTRFDRDLLEVGLRQLVARLRESGVRSGIRIVGGAALALRYFDRESTVDIDAHFIGSPEVVENAAIAVARTNGWPDDWLNSKAAGFIPEYGSKPVEWATLHDDGAVIIEVARPEALLAMKLKANRPGRDDTDAAKLMAICGIATLDQAEQLYEEHYSGEVLPDRAIRMVEMILRVGVPAVPLPQPDIDLEPRSD
ncbi:hypothetical protein [Agromyces bauzanensis]|uniref:Uncharacterized protein n=1 Tax=Agromyces bauzanensis TaxID=1308924 RepID=A0A917PRU5_9MICO|nr:hypothetical protein [Agromyces bauzanensis]GGJ88711.1 hypothetical protein GCM10011372_29110 [Agromyces bauzanensis]